MEIILDKSGRVVIPKEIRDDLGLKPGEVLHVEIFEDEVILKPLRGETPLYVKDGVLIFSGTATGNIKDAISTQREERFRKVMSQGTK